MVKLNSYATIAEFKAALANNDISSQELYRMTMERIAQVEPHIDALLESVPVDGVQASHDGLLSGIPGVVKANISVKGVTTSCASKILKTYKPVYNATVVERLMDHGAPIVAMANMDEFAMGSSTEYSAIKKTKNPWDVKRVPGGSSGGPAAAVAAGMVPWALGSDTGGSVRQPAALCGVVGMKPTYGRVSRYGLIAYGSSLDQVGPITRTVYDNALVLKAIAGHDVRDSSSHPSVVPDYTVSLTRTITTPCTIGIVEGILERPGMDPEIVEAITDALKTFESLGAVIKKVKLPTLDLSTPAYFIVSRAEAASNLARYDGVHFGTRSQAAGTLKDLYRNTRHEGFGQQVQSRIMVGNYVLSAGHADAFYQKACDVRTAIRAELAEAFNHIDVLIMPTHPVPAFPFDAYGGDTLQMDLQDYFTCFANIAGVPALSLPCGFTRMGLPIGMQLVGPHWSEERLYKIGYAYEQQTPWHTMHPDW